jgi:hypothetical protein
MEREIRRCQVVGDDGETYTVVELEEVRSDMTLKGRGEYRGMRRLELDDGREVYRLDNRLTIRGTGVKLPEID